MEAQIREMCRRRNKFSYIVRFSPPIFKKRREVARLIELVYQRDYEKGFLGPTVMDHVALQMDVYQEEICGPVLSVIRAKSPREAIELINENPYGNGTAIFTSGGQAAREFQWAVKVGMIGINVPIPVPMAYYSFGGWKASLFDDKHNGPEGVSFYTRGKVVTSRWLRVEAAAGTTYHFPTAR
jgi:malonate-semialdehyde dehydrogenase (acetylating)/methylmalonate-semialdehyde dehydrogenase